MTKALNQSNLEITINNGEPVTTSLNVAEVFGKTHKNVLQAIENKIADIPQDFRELNFQLSNYEVKSGRNITKKLPMYYLTKDGFSFLVMGFTGAKADNFKIAYINEFNRMSEELEAKAKKTLPVSKKSERPPLTPHTQKIADFQNTSERTINEIFSMCDQLCTELDKLANLPICTARDNLKTNPHTLLTDRFVDGMFKQTKDLKKMAHDFRTEFWRTSHFIANLSHMQGL